MHHQIWDMTTTKQNSGTLNMTYIQEFTYSRTHVHHLKLRGSHANNLLLENTLKVVLQLGDDGSDKLCDRGDDLSNEGLDLNSCISINYKCVCLEEGRYQHIGSG